MSKKILLTGGGTGGHIYPALAIADELKRRCPGSEVCFAGTREGLESRIVPEAGYPIEYIRAAGIERKITLRNLQSLGSNLGGMLDARALLGRFTPDVIIATGGYVCVPVLLMGALKNIPILIQEQNAVLGITNRLGQKFAQGIALGVSEAVGQISGDAKRIKITGNPVRPEFFEVSREEARKNLGLSDNERLILITGGSRGARTLNLKSLKLHQWVEEQEDIRLIHGTGQDQWAEISCFFSAQGLSLETAKRTMVPYLKNMAQLLRAADFIVSRAGALALAEIGVCGVPSLLIPYPYATENHQRENAKAYTQAGAAKMILDEDITEVNMRDIVAEIVKDSTQLGAMRQGALSLGKVDATEKITDMAIDLIKGVSCNDAK